MRTFAVSLFAAATLAACSGGGGEGGAPAINAQDMTMGDPNAPVEVVEYASAACSHCAEFAENTLPEFKAKYIDTGKARYAVRELLTDPIPYAASGFLLARCVEEERYFPVLDAVFRARGQLQSEADIRPALLGIASASGLSEEQFNECLGDDATKALDARLRENAKYTAGQGTPIFFINGKQEFSGAPTMEALDEVMTKALEKAGAN